MCGRFTLTADALEIQEEFNLAVQPDSFLPRYNNAPSQLVAIIRNAESNLEWILWGLVPFWAKEMSIGSRMINARSETLREKPAFRHAFAKQRCLILANGFYEWKKAEGKNRGGNQPYYFLLKSHKPFAFAGLWDINVSIRGTPLISCSIITCAANELVASVHDRMPVMMNAQTGYQWLAGSRPEDLEKLLKPFPSDLMIAHTVSKYVNDPQHDDQECIRPLASNQLDLL